MSENTNLANDIRVIYDRLQMEEVFHQPSESISVIYHRRIHQDSVGVLHKVQETNLILDIFARNNDEAIEVSAAFLANMRLKVEHPFGTRHGALLYILPIIHLIISLSVIVLAGLLWGLEYGFVFGVIAAFTIPLLIYWISISLTTRREILKENLELTGKFENSDEIDEMVAWLKTKQHSRGYWFKRVIFYELYYIPISIFLFLLYHSQ
ncbi:MAG: hypothetical protein ACTSW7_04310 [Candidatus Thorarchaeota archaeon]